MTKKDVTGAMTVAVADIQADVNQPRKLFDIDALEVLKKSVKENGILNPLIVEKQTNGKFMLINGERRFRVAQELKLKEVPVVVMESSSPAERMIKQFHIQEMAEGWTPAEKASVVMQLASELKTSLPKIAEMLGISQRTAQTYGAFAKIIDKKMFQRSNISLSLSTRILSLRNIVRKAFEDANEEFTDADEEKLEHAVIEHIKDGRIKGGYDFLKITDAVKADRKSIVAFMKDNSKITPQKMFIESNAAVLFNTRRARYGAHALRDHLTKGMELGMADILTSSDIAEFENARDILIQLVGNKK